MNAVPASGGVVRRLGRSNKKGINRVKELDVFPKLPEDYQERSSRGGTLSVFVLIACVTLLVLEFIFFISPTTTYSYVVDDDIDASLTINMDITIAMQCQYIGGDILELSGSAVDMKTRLSVEPAVFSRTSPRRFTREIFMSKGKGKGGVAIDPLTGQLRKNVADDSESEKIPTPASNDLTPPAFNACRFHGALNVSKVAGNLHFTLGQSFQTVHGHAHNIFNVPQNEINMTHRIDQLSFGDNFPGAVHPLDYTDKLTEEPQMMYQYFLRLVPTTFVHSNEDSIETNQLSVTEHHRSLGIGKSGGLPGIFMKYEIEPVRVVISDGSRGILHFLVRVSGIIGGIFTCTGLIHRLIDVLVDLVRGKSTKGNVKMSDLGNKLHTPIIIPAANTAVPRVDLTAMPMDLNQVSKAADAAV